MEGHVAIGLGATVRLRREERGLGQEQLAAALGVRQQTVSRWENGLAVPRPGRVVDLARALDLEPSALHRLAGYLPAADGRARGPAHERLSDLSSADLLLLIERAWDELRSRDGHAGPSAAQEQVAAG